MCIQRDILIYTGVPCRPVLIYILGHIYQAAVFQTQIKAGFLASIECCCDITIDESLSLLCCQYDLQLSLIFGQAAYGHDFGLFINQSIWECEGSLADHNHGWLGLLWNKHLLSWIIIYMYCSINMDINKQMYVKTTYTFLVD